MKLLRSQATEEDQAPALCLPVSKASVPENEGRQGPGQTARDKLTEDEVQGVRERSAVSWRRGGGTRLAAQPWTWPLPAVCLVGPVSCS